MSIAEVLAKIVIRERPNVVNAVMHHLIIGDPQVMIPQIRISSLMMVGQEIGVPRTSSVRQVMVRQTLILQARVMQRGRGLCSVVVQELRTMVKLVVPQRGHIVVMHGIDAIGSMLLQELRTVMLSVTQRRIQVVNGIVTQMLLHAIVKDVLLGPDRVLMERLDSIVLNMLLHPAEVLSPEMLRSQMLGAAEVLSPAKMLGAHMPAADMATTEATDMAATHVSTADVSTTHMTATGMSSATTVAMAGFKTRGDSECNAQANSNRNAGWSDHGQDSNRKMALVRDTTAFYPLQIAGDI